jgi:hypothetical protein
MSGDRAPSSRYVIDTNAFDVLAADEATLTEVEAAIEAGVIELIVTPLQWEEVGAITDSEKLERFRRLTTTIEPPVAVWGQTRWGEAVWGGPETAAAFDETMTEGSTKHYVDAQGLMAARRFGVPLVTADKRLIRRAEASGVSVAAPDAVLATVRRR